MKKLLVSVIIVILITSYYLFPMLESLAKIGITHFKTEQYNFLNYYTSIQNLFIIRPNYNSPGFAISHEASIGLIPLLFSSIGLFDTKIRNNAFLFQSALIGIFLILSTTSLINIELFSFMQFKFRVLPLALTLLIPVTVLMIDRILSMTKNKNTLLNLFVLIYLVYCSFPLFKLGGVYDLTKGYYDIVWIDYIDDDFHIVKVGDRYIFHGRDIYSLYIPYAGDMDYSKEGCLLDENYNKISCDLIREGLATSYYSETPFDTQKLYFPVIYYPGINASYINSKGNVNFIEGTQNKYNGWTTINISDIKDIQKISISYTGTKITKISFMLSIIGLVSFIVLLVKNKIKNN